MTGGRRAGGSRGWWCRHDVAFGPLPGPGVRLDAGFESGDEVGTFYDAMLAKVVATAPTRSAAIRRLAAALAGAELHGVRTNRDLLVEVLRSEAFLAGELSTRFLDEVPLPALEGRSMPGTATQQGLMLFAAAVARVEAAAARRPVQRAVPNGWRNVASGPQVVTFDLDGTEVRVGWLGGRDGYRFADVYDEVHGARTVRVEHPHGAGAPLRVLVEHDGVTHPFDVHLDGDRVDVESPLGHVALTVVPRFVDPADQVPERLAAGADAGLGRPGLGAARAAGLGRRDGARARGHEDAAHRVRAVRRVRQRGGGGRRRAGRGRRRAGRGDARRPGR